MVELQSIVFLCIGVLLGVAVDRHVWRHEENSALAAGSVHEPPAVGCDPQSTTQTSIAPAYHLWSSNAAAAAAAAAAGIDNPTLLLEEAEGIIVTEESSRRGGDHLYKHRKRRRTRGRSRQQQHSNNRLGSKDKSFPTQTILIIDTVAPYLYHGSNVSGPTGGSEKAVLRLVLELLRHDHWSVVLAQEIRPAGAEFTDQYGIRYIHASLERFSQLAHAEKLTVDSIIHQRYHKWMAELEPLWPDAVQHVWLHDEDAYKWPSKYIPVYEQVGVGVVTCSEYGRRRVMDDLRQHMPGQQHVPFPVQAIGIASTDPSSITDISLSVRTPHAYDPFKLLWLSAQWKGFENALQLLRLLRQIHSKYTLYVAFPSYGPVSDDRDRGVVYLGALDTDTLRHHVRTSLCIVSPNVIGETFGLVFSESNLQGTPVVAFEKGAAAEVLTLSGLQLLPNGHLDEVASTVDQWRKGARPAVIGSPQYQVEYVAALWMRYLLQARQRHRLRECPPKHPCVWLIAEGMQSRRVCPWNHTFHVVNTTFGAMPNTNKDTGGGVTTCSASSATTASLLQTIQRLCHDGQAQRDCALHVDLTLLNIPDPCPNMHKIMSIVYHCRRNT